MAALTATSLLLPAALSILPNPIRTQLALYTSDVCVAHDPGARHPDKPARLRTLLSACREKWSPQFGSYLRVCEPEIDVTPEQLRRVHTPKHLNTVNAAFAGNKLLLGTRVPIDADTIVSSGTAAAAQRAAGLVIAAVDDVLSTKDAAPSAFSFAKPKRAFVMARPPGHHAEASRPMGFCFYNNVMVGAAHAQAKYGVERIAILDFDVHHGNGDEDITCADPGWLYVSSHECPNFPGTGETPGRSGVHDNVVSAPLRRGAGSNEFRRAWRDQLLPAVRTFKPEVILLSAGFDAHAADPLSGMQLSDSDFAWLTNEVANLGKPIISVLEGGYNVEQLERSVKTHIASLINS
jgi:acetoin utilization deacetylase AcuC-like enzyme